MRGRVLAVLSFSVCSSWTMAQSSDCAISGSERVALARLINAPSQTAYDGSILYEYSGGRQFVSVTWPEESGQGQLRRLNSHEDPEPELWRQPISPVGTVCQLDRVYSVSVEEGRVIAGRSTQRVSLRPRDTLRLAQVFELDRDTGIALAAMAVDPGGAVLERFEFADIALRALPQPALAPAPEREMARREVIPGYHVLAPHSERGAVVVSDGLATASVFVEPLPPGSPAGEGATQRGATLTYARGVLDGQQGVLITVMGEIPIVTARLLADSVHRSSSAP